MIKEDILFILLIIWSNIYGVDIIKKYIMILLLFWQGSYSILLMGLKKSGKDMCFPIEIKILLLKD